MTRRKKNREGLKKLRSTSVEDLHDMYWNQDMTVQDIADHFEVSFNAVRLHLDKIGVPKRNRLEASERMYRHISDESMGKIVAASRKNLAKAHTPEVRSKNAKRMAEMNRQDWHKPHSRRNLHICRKISKSYLRNTDDKFQLQLFYTLDQVFEGQVEYDHPVCEYSYFLDIAIPDAMTSFEIDSEQCHNEDTAEADRVRQNNIEKVGWTIHRITHEELVKNFFGVVGKIVALIKANLRTSAEQPGSEEETA